MKKKLLHPGNLIIAGFIILALALLGLVYKASTIETQFSVEGDYYAKEAGYNKLMEARAAAEALGSDFLMKETATEIQIQIPAHVSKSMTQGSVTFFCIPNSKLDVQAPLQASQDGLYVFAKQEVIKGHNYKIKVAFTSAGKEYYKEFELL